MNKNEIHLWLLWTGYASSVWKCIMWHSFRNMWLCSFARGSVQNIIWICRNCVMVLDLSLSRNFIGYFCPLDQQFVWVSESISAGKCCVCAVWCVDGPCVAHGWACCYATGGDWHLLRLDSCLERSGRPLGRRYIGLITQQVTQKFIQLCTFFCGLCGGSSVYGRVTLVRLMYLWAVWLVDDVTTDVVVQVIACYCRGGEVWVKASIVSCIPCKNSKDVLHDCWQNLNDAEVTKLIHIL